MNLSVGTVSAEMAGEFSHVTVSAEMAGEFSHVTVSVDMTGESVCGSSVGRDGK